MSLVADGTISMETVEGIKQIDVAVWEKDLIAGRTVEDAARTKAHREIEPDVGDVVGVDLS